ncbi:MAG TPA: hypothetical protein VNG51_19440 [Ktedonobacteraceae bacterium]|nr:hypothetical protein [Ktedonobacteraceae bacterium]
MPSLQASGTETPTVGTEAQLADTNVAGVFSFHVDTVNMATGDITELRVYQMVLTAGTSRVVFEQTFYGVQLADDLIKISLPIGNDLTDSTALRFSLKQTFGTARAYPWKVLKY